MIVEIITTLVLSLIVMFVLAFGFMLRCLYLDRKLMTVQHMLKGFGIELTWKPNSVSLVRREIEDSSDGWTVEDQRIAEENERAMYEDEY